MNHSSDMNMRYLHQLSLFIATIPILLGSCTYDTESNSKKVDLTYDISQSTIQNFPYSKFDSVIFIDSVNNECSFKVSESKSQYWASLEPIQKQEGEEMVNYFLTNERYGCNIKCDSLSLEFRIEIKTEPDKYSIKERGVKDVITVYKVNNDNSEKTNQSSVFFFTVDQRNHLGTNKDTLIKEVTILGKQYYNVYNANTYCKNEIKMMYNFEYGILSFLEENGNYWRFKEAIVKNGS